MGAQTDRLRCEVFQNLILSPINTGFLRHAVATALTVYGIETSQGLSLYFLSNATLQQPLPFTVLKQSAKIWASSPTKNMLQQPLPFTVLKQTIWTTYRSGWVGGCNSPYRLRYWNPSKVLDAAWFSRIVATALTVYGIETIEVPRHGGGQI